MIRFHFDKHETPAHQMTDSYILAKRREHERLFPNYPKWDPDFAKKEQQMSKSASPLDEVADLSNQLRAKTLGKGEAFLKMKSAYGRSGLFDLSRKTASGAPMSGEQQLQDALQRHPVFSDFKAAHDQGLESTEGELAKHFASVGPEPVAKKETSTASEAYLQLEKMALTLQKRLKDEQNLSWTKEACFAFLCKHTDRGAALFKADKVARLGPTFADVA